MSNTIANAYKVSGATEELRGSIPKELFLRQICLEMGDGQFKNYDSLLMPLRKAYQEVGYTTPITMRVAEYKLDNLRAVQLPYEAVSIKQVSIRNGNRAIILFEDCGMQTDDDCGCKNKTEASTLINNFIGDNEFGYDFNSYDRINWTNNRGDIGEVYSARSGVKAYGFYKYDEATKVIHIDSSLAADSCSLIVRYLSNVYESGLDFIPILYEGALKMATLVDYFSIRNRNSCLHYQKELKKEMSKLHDRRNPKSVDEWMYLFTSNYTSVPK